MADNAMYDSDDDNEAPMLVSVQPTTELKSNQDGAKTEAAPCPVTILSGFLGAGKTTLIQYILQSSDHGKRIAVIENEFGGGDEGLSVESMIARDGANNANLSDLIELPNGCMCCTVKDSLVATLENLIDRKNDLDYILIEASGMANPGPIASLFWLDDALESRLRLDGVVTLIDSYNIQRQLRETEEAAQQIAYADRLLLNKVDLIDSSRQDDIVATIRTIHPTAPILSTSYSQVPDLDWILDANCYDADRAKEVDRALLQVDHVHSSDEPECVTCVKAQHEGHVHTRAVGTVAFVEHGSVDLTLMNKWLASILWPNQDEQDKVLRARLEQDYIPEDQPKTTSQQIFRIKGIVSVRHVHVVDAEDEAYVDTEGLDSRRYIVQAVHDLWEIHPASDNLRWDEPLDEQVSPRTCKLVVIGKFLREDELHEGFKSCFATC